MRAVSFPFRRDTHTHPNTKTRRHKVPQGCNSVRSSARRYRMEPCLPIGSGYFSASVATDPSRARKRKSLSFPFGNIHRNEQTTSTSVHGQNATMIALYGYCVQCLRLFSAKSQRQTKRAEDIYSLTVETNEIPSPIGIGRRRDRARSSTIGHVEAIQARIH